MEETWAVHEICYRELTASCLRLRHKSLPLFFPLVKQHQEVTPKSCLLVFPECHNVNRSVWIALSKSERFTSVFFPPCCSLLQGTSCHLTTWLLHYCSENLDSSQNKSMTFCWRKYAFVSFLKSYSIFQCNAKKLSKVCGLTMACPKKYQNVCRNGIQKCLDQYWLTWTDPDIPDIS